MAPSPEVQDNGAVISDTKMAKKALQLDSIRKAIPAEAFQKSPLKGTYYMLKDYAMWGMSIYAIYGLTNSSIWATMPQYQQILASILYFNVAGFLMWCMFITGHDCGHGTFSNNELLNDIVGHISHGSIMVPFYSWQVHQCIYVYIYACIYACIYIYLCTYIYVCIYIRIQKYILDLA
jgi:omega-3 fatty acid desaturase (delta-15 desaturase)